MQLFAGIDHAAGAAEAELTLAPTELIIFGNAAPAKKDFATFVSLC
jgi:uncharacterized protein (DUF302 family)